MGALFLIIAFLLLAVAQWAFLAMYLRFANSLRDSLGLITNLKVYGAWGLLVLSIWFLAMLGLTAIGVSRTNLDRVFMIAPLIGAVIASYFTSRADWTEFNRKFQSPPRDWRSLSKRDRWTHTLRILVAFVLAIGVAWGVQRWATERVRAKLNRYEPLQEFNPYLPPKELRPVQPGGN